MNRYIRIGTLVAFSGEVQDPALNPNLRGRDMLEAFATGEYRVLLVANKVQTGFDQRRPRGLC